LVDPFRGVQILRVHISNEEDMHFLHTLEVSEDDFQALKAEHCIHVDFSNFPGKIIDLLGKCIESQGEALPRYQSILTMSGGESKLQIVETNDFRKVSHVTLNFRPGDDLTVKQFLAFNFCELKEICGKLEKELKDSKRDGQVLQGRMGQARSTLEDAGYSHRQQTMEARANLKATHAAGLEGSSWERYLPRDHTDRERGQLDQHLREELEALRACNKRLEAENRELLAVKQDVSSKVSEHCIPVAHRERILLQADRDKLRDQSHQLSSEKRNLELKMSDAKVSTRGLKERLAGHMDSFAEYKAQIDSLESAKVQLEVRVEELKQSLAKAEEKAKELANGKKESDEIIEKFMRDLHEARERTRKISAQHMRQEDIIVQLRSQVQEATREKEQAQNECDKALGELSQLESGNMALKDQLEQCQKKLQETNNTLYWLQSQDAQLQPSPFTHARGFRPSVLPPSNSQMSPTQMVYPGLPGQSPPVQPHPGQSPRGQPHPVPPPAQPRNPNFMSRYQALRD
ncbi:unnamed protein product, partial [Ostreobium quekettii]